MDWSLGVELKAPQQRVSQLMGPGWGLLGLGWKGG